MRIAIKLCDSCAKDYDVSLAKGEYQFDTQDVWSDACDRHLKEVERAGAVISKYDFLGDVNFETFYTGKTL